MKYLFILYILISANFIVVANSDIECDSPAILDPESEKSFKGILIPNCARRTPKGIEIVPAEFLNAACKECMPRFKSSTNAYGIKDAAKPLNLKNIFVDELKKSLADILSDLASLKSVYNMEGDYSSAESSCNVQNFIQKSSSCLGSSDIQDLKDKLQNEMVRILSVPPKFDNLGILKREEAGNTCNFSDFQVLSAKSAAVENLLSSPSIIQALANIDPNDPSAINSVFKDQDGSARNMILLHPALSRFRNDKLGLKKFFSSFKLPITNTDFGKALYSDKKNTQPAIDHFAERCTNTFKSFNEICSKMNNNDNFKITNLPRKGPLMDTTLFSKEDTVNLLSNQIDQNFSFLKYCPLVVNKSLGAVDVENERIKISNGISPFYKTLSLQDYSATKYNKEISTLSNDLCALSNDSKACEVPDFKCSILRSLKNQNIPGTKEFALATTSNPKVNGIIRAILGENKTPPPELIKAGIYPQANGTFIPQPKVAEREPGYIPTPGQTSSEPQPAQASQAPRLPPTVNPIPKPTSTATRTTAAATAETPATESTATTSIGDNFSTGDPQEDAFRSNLMDRLKKAKAKSPTQAVTQDFVKRQIADAFQERGTPVPPEYATSEYVGEVARQLNNGATSLPRPVSGQAAGGSGTVSSNKAAMSDAQRQAFEGMAGAQAAAGTSDKAEEQTASRSPASTFDSASIALDANVLRMNSTALIDYLKKTERIEELVGKPLITLKFKDATYTAKLVGNRYEVAATSTNNIDKRFAEEIQRFLTGKLNTPKIAAPKATRGALVDSLKAN